MKLFRAIEVVVIVGLAAVMAMLLGYKLSEHMYGIIHSHESATAVVLAEP